MDRRQRVRDAIEHRETDSLPYQCDLTSQERERLMAHPDGKAIAESIRNHIAAYTLSGAPREIPGRPSFFEDDYGVVWNRSGADRDIGVIEGVLIPDLSDVRYALPEPDLGAVREGMGRFASGAGDRYRAAGIGFSMFERAWTLCSMEGLLEAMATEPEGVHALLDAICEHDLKIVDVMLEYDVDALYFGDDWGQQRGLIMGAPYWREFIKPRMARLYARGKEAGKKIIQHSCGDIREIFEDVIEIGLDVYQTFQPEIYGLAETKRRYGGRLAFWGGISTQGVLPFGTPEQVREETAATLRVMGVGGGYIPAPTHGVPQDVPPENLKAMLDVLNDQGRYV